ncbi:Uncharacterised protein [BD1-7 clade bacterium]|uniref:SH3b domain-containing protein n=1 Tax=BD1-7 clade bacterium TaxID=2029982 RepID=A0A5S9QNU5_9GAMM|nr:Uncharacterised protein [BD1-7 clade bacterium]CAA0120811.1 Uncharacterised protein [BD1-7 clade bacterium]
MTRLGMIFLTALTLAAPLGLSQDNSAASAAASTEAPAVAANYDTSKAGQRVYIRDYLYVPLRSGESARHRIVNKGLKSGTALTLVKTNADSGYSLVRTSRNAEGWIPTQYLVDAPTAAIELAKARETIKNLTQKAGPLSEQLLDQKRDSERLTIELQGMRQENIRLDRELTRVKDLAANSIELDANNKRLMQANEQLKNTQDALAAEKERLQSQLKSDDFINGALVLFAGMMLTIFVQYFANSKKKSDWR